MRSDNARLFDWEADLAHGPLALLRPSHGDAVSIPAGVTARLVAGPLGSGVTATLRFLSEQLFEQVEEGTLESVWVDCKKIMSGETSPPLSVILQRRLGIGRIATLRGMVGDLLFRTEGAGVKAYLIVIDHVEVLPRHEANWLLRSLSSLQRDSAASSYPLGGQHACRVLLLVGGAVTGEAAVVGADQELVCLTVIPPLLSPGELSEVHASIQQALTRRNFLLEPSVLPWLQETIGGDILAANFVYGQILSQPELYSGQDRTLSVSTTRELLENPSEALTQTLTPGPRLLLDFIDVLPRMLELFPPSGAVAHDFSLEPPRLREFLFRLGYIRLLNGTLATRGILLKKIIHRLVNVHRAKWSSLNHLASFLTDCIGLSVSDLRPEAATPAAETIRSVLSQELDRSLLFLYYATVEVIKDDVVRLWSHRPDGSEAIVFIRSRDSAPTLAVGSALLYYGTSTENGQSSTIALL